MSEDNKLLDKFKGKVDKYIDKIDDLVEGEVPELFNEILTHGRIIHTIYLVVAVVILCIAAYLTYYSINVLECSEHSYRVCREESTTISRVCSVILLVGSMANVIYDTVNSIKVFFTPRLYLVDKLRGRVNE
jgi:hypothetical protein